MYKYIYLYLYLHMQIINVESCPICWMLNHAPYVESCLICWIMPDMFCTVLNTSTGFPPWRFQARSCLGTRSHAAARRAQLFCWGKCTTCYPYAQDTRPIMHSRWGLLSIRPRHTPYHAFEMGVAVHTPKTHALPCTTNNGSWFMIAHVSWVYRIAASVQHGPHQNTSRSTKHQGA